MRVLLDTNILLSALLSRGTPPDRLYEEWRHGRFDLVSCERQLEELKQVSRRPFFLNRLRPSEVGRMVNDIRRIYTDGRPPELVRGVDLIGTPLAAFGKILATDDQIDVFNGVCGAESGGVPVSASSPSLLVSEVEVQKKSQSQETRPILPAPPASRKS